MFNDHAIWNVNLMLAIEQPSSVRDLGQKLVELDVRHIECRTDQYRHVGKQMQVRSNIVVV
jgi:hypothetical protein